ncbi:MAG: protein kinase [Planctomycetes bacterium RBG_16_64_10]|nr:MAG: protein kinase [Planctomycetes bacterium RBG_16_64_10]
MGFGRILKSLLDSGRVDIQARYEILREAVSGTMSKFFKARDRETGEIVGLKVLDKDKTALFEARFRGLNKPNEGEIAVQLCHPRIVRTIRHGMTTRGELFLVMEFLDGPGLNSLIIGRHPELSGQELAFVRQAAEAVAAVHQAGFIHRDICPRNFVTNREITALKLIDFGLTVPATPAFMQPGNRTGTPTYMSPEVVRRRPTDQRLDIFSFGVSAYELLTFELPWERGSGDGMAAMAHDTREPTPIEARRPGIHPTLAQAIMQCLAADVDRRPKTIERFLQAIHGLRSVDVT